MTRTFTFQRKVSSKKFGIKVIQNYCIVSELLIANNVLVLSTTFHINELLIYKILFTRPILFVVTYKSKINILFKIVIFDCNFNCSINYHNGGYRKPFMCRHTHEKCINPENCLKLKRTHSYPVSIVFTPFRQICSVIDFKLLIFFINEKIL